MSASAKKPLLVGMALVGMAWGGAAAVQVSLDRLLPSYRQAPDLLWIPSGEVMRKLSFGHDGLLANLYWTRVVQYYGGRLRDRRTDFELLAPLLDITVTLDPQLLVAYYFGSFFLSGPPPRGAGEPEKAVALLHRGIQANPQEWRLWHHLGFLQYWELKDYPAAAAAYLEGSKHPNARPWMKVMAAIITEKGGNRDTSRFLWTEIHQSAEDPFIRKNALDHLQSIQATEDIEELEKRAAAFRQRTGRWPRSFREMIAQGLLQNVPADPSGVAYRLGAEGKVTLDPNSQIRSLDIAPSPPSEPPFDRLRAVSEVERRPRGSGGDAPAD